MKVKGTLSSWQTEKGFGFITADTDASRTFVHINEFKRFRQQAVVGQEIIYTLTKDKQGRACAKIAKIDGIKLKQHKSGNSRVFIALIFYALIGMSIHLGHIPELILFLYLILSVITFFLYAADKLRAKKGWQRTQENTLHFFSLIGGWPGAIFAQQLFRHKTQKKEFRFIFWVTVFINIGVIIWLHTTQGAAQLQKWLPYLQQVITPLEYYADSALQWVLSQWRAWR